MCGLVGMAGDINSDHKKMFRDLLVIDQIRGFDSTGVALIKAHVPVNTHHAHIEKDLGAAQNLWEWSKSGVFTDRGIVKSFPKAMIGHNRAATVGKINIDSAHPFEYGHIIGAHNGTLRQYSDLADAKTFDVDSKAIFNDISENGIDHTWKNFTGAAALSFWDEVAGTINLIRNKERTLYIAWSKDQKTLFWASEYWMLFGVALRHGVELYKKENGQVLYKLLSEDVLYSFKVTSLNCVALEERKLEKKIFTSPVVTPVVQYQAGFSGTSNGSKTLVQQVKDFKVSKDWKNGTESTKLDLEKVKLFNIRKVNLQVLRAGKQTTETTFCFDMREDGKHVGVLRVYAQNRKEFLRLLKSMQQYAGGANIAFKLTDNPRVVQMTKNSAMPTYVCTYSCYKSFTPATNNVVDMSPPAPLRVWPGPNNQDLPKAAFEAAVKAIGGCCCYCDKTIVADDEERPSWAASDQILCSECTWNWGGYYYPGSV